MHYTLLQFLSLCPCVTCARHCLVAYGGRSSNDPTLILRLSQGSPKAASNTTPTTLLLLLSHHAAQLLARGLELGQARVDSKGSLEGADRTFILVDPTAPTRA
jgi:hypothetical protein